MMAMRLSTSLWYLSTSRQSTGSDGQGPATLSTEGQLEPSGNSTPLPFTDGDTQHNSDPALLTQPAETPVADTSRSVDATQLQTGSQLALPSGAGLAIAHGTREESSPALSEGKQSCKLLIKSLWYQRCSFSWDPADSFAQKLEFADNGSSWLIRACKSRKW